MSSFLSPSLNVPILLAFSAINKAKLLGESSFRCFGRNSVRNSQGRLSLAELVPHLGPLSASPLSSQAIDSRSPRSSGPALWLSQGGSEAASAAQMARRTQEPGPGVPLATPSWPSRGSLGLSASVQPRCSSCWCSW